MHHPEPSESGFAFTHKSPVRVKAGAHLNRNVISDNLKPKILRFGFVAPEVPNNLYTIVDGVKQAVPFNDEVSPTFLVRFTVRPDEAQFAFCSKEKKLLEGKEGGRAKKCSIEQYKGDLHPLGLRGVIDLSHFQLTSKMTPHIILLAEVFDHERRLIYFQAKPVVVELTILEKTKFPEFLPLPVVEFSSLSPTAGLVRQPNNINLSVNLPQSPVHPVVVMLKMEDLELPVKVLFATPHMVSCTLPSVTRPGKACVLFYYNGVRIACNGDDSFYFVEGGPREDGVLRSTDVGASDSVDDFLLSLLLDSDDMDMTDVTQFTQTTHYLDNGWNEAVVAAAAGRVKLLEQLLRDRYDLNKADKKNRSPLWWAACCGRMDAVKFLLGQGVALDTVSSEDHSSAMHILAARGEWRAVTKMIRMGADVRAVDFKGRTPLQLAKKSFSQEEYNCLQRVVNLQPSQREPVPVTGQPSSEPSLPRAVLDQEIKLKRDFSLNVLLAGESGAGKTTFLRSMMQMHPLEEEKLPPEGSTKEFYGRRVVIPRGHAQGSTILTYYDSPGWGNEELHVTKEKLLNFISLQYQKFQKYLQSRIEMADSVEGEANPYIHVIFYFLLPHRVKNFDLDFIAALQQFTPVIVLLAKADSYESGELELMHAEVARRITEHESPIDVLMTSPRSNRKSFAIVGTRGELTRSLMWSKQQIRPWDESDPTSKFFDNIKLLRFLKESGFDELDKKISTELYRKWTTAMRQKKSQERRDKVVRIGLRLFFTVLLLAIVVPFLFGVRKYFLV